MSYHTHWDLLDKNKKVVQEFVRICFSNHLNQPFYEIDEETEEDENGWGGINVVRNGSSKLPPHYFRYKFHNAKVTDEEMEKYFRFIKATPEFKHLMPKSIKQMVKAKAYTADLTQINGTQLFAILTVLRAVVEEPEIVRSVAKFNHRMKHAIPHLGILKAAGSSHSQNYHHWLHQWIDQHNLTKGINDEYEHMWNSPQPALETGLVTGLHEVFQHPGDGYTRQHPVRADWADKMLEAQKAKQGKPLVKDRKVIRPIPPLSLGVAAIAW